MNHRLTRLMLLLSFTIWPSAFAPVVAAPDTEDALAEKAERFVDQLSRGSFDEAAAPFDAAMRGAAPPDKLKQIWFDLIEQTGPFQAMEGSRVEDAGAYRFVFVSCRFSEAALDVKVVFNHRSEISGMFFTESPSDYQAPVYVKPGSFTEEEVIVGRAPWELPGTLTLPWAEGPFPAVLLVHGSGPNDRDETIGPNKPFKDLAWGLASRGIAVLRYDKRTHRHGLKLASADIVLTVEEEVLADALEGITLLREQRDVDPDRVFVLGHSLGGYLAPRLAARDEGLAGLILLAAPARGLDDLILEQMDYIVRADGEMSAEDDSLLAAIRAQVTQVKSLALRPETPRELLPLGVPATYWLDLRGYYPAALAALQKTPMLVVQGGRDYQVRDTDFELWREALSLRADVRFAYFPDLNHLFMIGEGMSRPEEYRQAGHVDPRVLRAVADWVKQ